MAITPPASQQAFRALIAEMRLPYLRFSLTADCNADCNFCHNEGVKHGARGEKAILQPADLDEGKIGYIADYFKSQFKKVSFTGGEPTLASNLDNIVRIFAERGYSTHMTTNGFLLDEAMQSRLAKSGLRHINVSLHSTSAEDHADVFGVQGQLSTVINNLQTISTYFPDRVKINFMAIPGKNIPDQLLPLSLLGAQTNITISYLTVVKDRKIENATSKGVIEYLEHNLGKPSIQKLNDKFGSRYIYSFDNGAKWEFDDFRRDEYRLDAFNNAVCRECTRKDACTEGPYALRITHKGDAKPCLIRNDNIVPLRKKGYQYRIGNILGNRG